MKDLESKHRAYADPANEKTQRKKNLREALELAQVELRTYRVNAAQELAWVP